jgi:GxxExxY protein
MGEFLHKELSYPIIGAAIEVHRLLSPGFLENVYEQALAHELTVRQIPFGRKLPLKVHYEAVNVGDYKADIVVDGKIILELKAVATLAPAHESQAHHYLLATGLRLAMILSFGAESL